MNILHENRASGTGGHGVLVIDTGAPFLVVSFFFCAISFLLSDFLGLLDKAMSLMYVATKRCNS